MKQGPPPPPAGATASQPAKAGNAGGTAVLDQTPTASAIYGGLKTESSTDARSNSDVFDFNRPDNPLRGSFETESKPAVTTEKAEPANGNGKANGQPEAFEDELDTPAFLRRRRNLFE
jgi:hypothetical protein